MADVCRIEIPHFLFENALHCVQPGICSCFYQTVVNGFFVYLPNHVVGLKAA